MTQKDSQDADSTSPQAQEPGNQRQSTDTGADVEDTGIPVQTWHQGWETPPPFTATAPPSWREIHAHAISVVPEPAPPPEDPPAGAEQETGLAPELEPRVPGVEAQPQPADTLTEIVSPLPPEASLPEPQRPIEPAPASAIAFDDTHAGQPQSTEAQLDTSETIDLVDAEPAWAQPIIVELDSLRPEPRLDAPRDGAATSHRTPSYEIPPALAEPKARVASFTADAGGVEHDVQQHPAAWQRLTTYARTTARYAAYAIAGYFALVFFLILLYRFVNPPASMLMIVQGATGTDVRQEWVPLDEISPSLIRAVIVSEDWSFCEHYGIDVKAIEQAIERSGSGIPRGASTISMQLTKNLFLWNAKSYIRKAIEVPLTLMIELIWPKWRILEVYLNVAEWGPGVFGAEAAAQYHFNKSAVHLGDREAAQLAASLPNPMIRDAGDPGPQTARKANVVQSRMRNAGGAAQCVLVPRRQMAQ